MGLFNFWQKKNPLDDLNIPSEFENMNTSDNQNPFTSQNSSDLGDLSSQNSFSQSTNQLQEPSFDTHSLNQQSQDFNLPTDQVQSNNITGQQSKPQFEDHFANYQKAVNEYPSNFQTNEREDSRAQNNTGNNNNESSNYRDHNTELILSKLDVIKTMIDNLNHRITVLESKYDLETERRKRSW